MIKRAWWFFGPALVVVGYLATVGAESACTPKQAVRTAIDVAIAACIAEHADIEDEAELKKVCQWAEELGPVIKDLLAARKKGMAKKMGACAPDGGR